MFSNGTTRTNKTVIDRSIDRASERASKRHISHINSYQIGTEVERQAPYKQTITAYKRLFVTPLCNRDIRRATCNLRLAARFSVFLAKPTPAK